MKNTSIQVEVNWLLKCYLNNYIHIHQEFFFLELFSTVANKMC